MNQADLAVHKIEGLPNVLVDGFRHRLPEAVPRSDRVYVLTHFHSDHYTGLTERFDHGTIYCTKVTANFILKILKVSPAVVRALDFDCPLAIPGGATLEFLDANHCPGAALVLVTLCDGTTRHLHTGDMRYDPKMKTYPSLQPSAGDIHNLYLDSTYCHPRHTFCNQAESIDVIVTEARAFLQVCPMSLVKAMLN